MSEIEPMVATGARGGKTIAPIWRAGLADLSVGAGILHLPSFLLNQIDLELLESRVAEEKERLLMLGFDIRIQMFVTR